MEGLFVVKVVAGVFLALFIGIPIYLLITKPRKRYRTSSLRRTQRMVAGISALSLVIFAFLILAVMVS